MICFLFRGECILLAALKVKDSSRLFISAVVSVADLSFWFLADVLVETAEDA